MGGLQLASRDLAGRHGSFSRTERPQPEVMLGAGTSGCTGTGLLEMDRASNFAAYRSRNDF